MLWMHTEAGRLVGQFRGFMLNAYSKQLLHNVNHADGEMFAKFTWGMAFAGLSYAAQTSINYANDPELLEQKLSMEEIGKAAFQRAGLSTVLPLIADTAARMTGNEAPFSARTTGLGQGILGIPIIDAAVKAQGASEIPLGRFGDAEFSKLDRRNITGLLPVLNNFFGIRNVWNAIDEGYDLPARSK